jgi:arylsulfatase A-like enzyme
MQFSNPQSGRSLMVVLVITLASLTTTASRAQTPESTPETTVEQAVTKEPTPMPEATPAPEPTQTEATHDTAPAEGTSPTTDPDQMLQGTGKRPNFLVIVTDDQRLQGTMRVMPKVRRAIGGHGVTYRNGVVTTPLCCPSRASIFSGKYAHNHRVWNNRRTALFDTSETAQAVLRHAGYLTALSGKYLNGWRKLADKPRDFDRYATWVGSPGYYNSRFVVNGAHRRIKSYSTRFVGRMARRFLGSFQRHNDARPWLLYVNPFAPHHEATPEKKFRHAPVPRFRPPPSFDEADVSDKPWVAEQVDRTRLSWVKAFRRRQLRSLMSVDNMVANLITRLQDLRELENTFIVYTSDNGWSWGEHRMNNKYFPYDEALRVPFLVRWDGRLQRGVDDRIVANIDITATMFDAARVTPPYPVDGRSLLRDRRRNAILIESPRDTITPEYSSVWSPGEVFVHFEAGFDELYSDDDPYQLNNVLARCDPAGCPNINPFLDLLAAWRRCSGLRCP